MPTSTQRKHWRAFLLALGMAAVLFLPFVIWDKGYFLYYGDFNVQQVPFYKLAHEAVRSGDLFWSFYTDLGANFIGSYSFYLLFSPFFWLTLPFPTAWVPLLMAPLLILKTACAALTAYLFLERFVRDRDFAVIGAILYAFSGWMFFNIFFNHFHDVAVFFPLLLLGVEKLVTEDKKGFFALMVCINAMVNYWFFVGEVVFTILYVLIRMTDKTWPMRPGKFARIALEAVLGLGLAAFALVPSVMALMGNPRTGADNLLTGWNLWIYWQDQNKEAILQSLFFPPELPARLNFFPEAGAAWSSRSAWLPLVGLSGVLAYFFQRKNDWVKKLLALSLVMALVPGLNSLFILLNHSYYARWFYMPILLMCLASARALEDSREDAAPMSRGLKWSLVAVLVFTAVCGLTPHKEDDQWKIGLEKTPFMLWVYAAVALTCLLLLTLLVVRLRHHRRFKTFLGVGVAVVSVSFGIFYLAQGKNSNSLFIRNSAIGGRDIISLPDDGESFSRIDVYDGLDNLGMYWHRPTIQAFHSIVPNSIMEFYPLVGVKRDVASRPEADYYALRPLLSVRWLFIERDKKTQEPMPGYVFYGEQAGFNIYENENYLPMGFAYSEFIDTDQFMDVSEKQRSNLLLRYIALDWDAIERNQDLMEWAAVDTPLDDSYDTMVDDVFARLDMSCYDFAHDRKGFTAWSDLNNETLMFFSVPYEAGWSATVNGRPAIIEKANVGFMAVRVPAGEAVIRFDYTTPGLRLGILCSGGALILWMLYMLATSLSRESRELRRALAVQRTLFKEEAVGISWEEHLQRLARGQMRPKGELPEPSVAEPPPLTDAAWQALPQGSVPLPTPREEPGEPLPLPQPPEPTQTGAEPQGEEPQAPVPPQQAEAYQPGSIPYEVAPAPYGPGPLPYEQPQPEPPNPEEAPPQNPA